ncbi:unnamed protein product [Phaedon cochleariae]|uniref:Uncharacterized protein n=1 Tax=Phaedon cochleariae TaxID=80249 RepID=A0A9N9X0W4_PHACE|nr:unnamed protein product [Phaedon cochleariae]
MKSAAMLKRENATASANVLMCKQWWKVCWMYGDQEKYYRQLYGKNFGRPGDVSKDFPEGAKDSNRPSADFRHQSFYENAGNVALGVQESVSLEEIRTASPASRRNDSPGYSSLEMARGIDE